MPKPSLHLLLIATVVLVGISTVAGLAWNTVRLTRTSHEATLHAFAQQRSQLLGHALAPDLSPPDRDGLLATLSLLRDDAALRYATVLDADLQLVVTLGEPPPTPRTPVGEGRRIGVVNGTLITEQDIVLDERPVGMLQLGFDASAPGTLALRSGLQNTAIVLAGLLLLIGTTLAAGYGLRRSLRQLNGAARALQQGRWEHRVPEAGSRLTRELATAFNALAAHLQSDHQTLRNRQDELLKGSRRLNTLLRGIGAVVWEANPTTGRFIYVSEEAELLLGHPVREWLGEDFITTHVHTGDQDILRGMLSHPGNAAGSFNLDFRATDCDGAAHWLRMFSSVEIREQGPTLAGLLLDITDEKQAERHMAYLADHDSLTGLINRRHFQEKLQEHIAYSRRYGTSGALLFIDLDQFKYINDSYGHQTGDEYLRQVARHIKGCLRETDVIGRLGGDEFGIVLPNVDADQANQASEALLRKLNGYEFIHEGRRTPFKASIGIALFPPHGEQASDLLAKADSAMYIAKDLGRNTYRIFEESVDMAPMHDKVHWEDRIRAALAEGGMQLHFQPIVDLKTGAIRHYESLLRMVGDEGKPVGPEAFVPIAERFGMIADIDNWVVEHAIRAQGQSIAQGNPVSLTVNLSGRHFGRHQILELIQDATRRHGADPARLVFEVTETTAVENFTEARDFIEALRELGYRFALDDFGAGFSSFHYLKFIPVDYVKIDGSFVRNLTHDRADRIFVKAIADMAHGLGVTPIAEFVESKRTLDQLLKLGINLGQGYFFARPSPTFHTYGRIPIEALPERSARSAQLS